MMKVELAQNLIVHNGQLGKIMHKLKHNYNAFPELQTLGLFQTSNFSCAESNANELNSLF